MVVNEWFFKILNESYLKFVLPQDLKIESSSAENI